MLFLLTILPTLSLYAMKGEARVYTYMIVISFLVIIGMTKIPLIRISRFRGGQTLAVVFSALLVLIVTISLIKKGGLQYFNLNLKDVYEFRGIVGSVINEGIYGYINIWVFKVLNPALLVWALYKKKPLLFLTSISLQILFFAISSHKAVLFLSFSYYSYVSICREKRALYYIYIGFLSVIIGTGLLAIYTDLIMPSSLFIRRLLFIPAQLYYAYYDFFTNAGHVYLTTSIFSLILEYPFPPSTTSYDKSLFIWRD